MKTGNFIAIDFETATNDREPCQLGIVVVNNWDIVQKMSYLIQPENNKYDIHCTNVHGISAVHTKNAPTFPEVWKEVKPYFDKYDAVAHNAASFDADVLFKAVEKYNLEHSECEFTCTLKMTGLGLEESCEMYGIPLINHHDAMFDAEACAKLYIKMMNDGVIAPPITPKSTQNEYPEQLSGDLLGMDLDGADPTHPLYEKEIAITGNFSKWGRPELAKIFKSKGAHMRSTVTNNINFVAVGVDAGKSKLAKIEKLRSRGQEVTILYEADIEKLLNL